jgi:hypothetical protein
MQPLTQPLEQEAEFRNYIRYILLGAEGQDLGS